MSAYYKYLFKIDFIIKFKYNIMCIDTNTMVPISEVDQNQNISEDKLINIILSISSGQLDNIHLLMWLIDHIT